MSSSRRSHNRPWQDDSSQPNPRDSNEDQQPDRSSGSQKRESSSSTSSNRKSSSSRKSSSRSEERRSSDTAYDKYRSLSSSNSAARPDDDRIRRSSDSKIPPSSRSSRVRESSSSSSQPRVDSAAATSSSRSGSSGQVLSSSRNHSSAAPLPDASSSYDRYLAQRKQEQAASAASAAAAPPPRQEPVSSSTHRTRTDTSPTPSGSSSYERRVRRHADRTSRGTTSASSTSTSMTSTGSSTMKTSGSTNDVRAGSSSRKKHSDAHRRSTSSQLVSSSAHERLGGSHHSSSSRSRRSSSITGATTSLHSQDSYDPLERAKIRPSSITAASTYTTSSSYDDLDHRRTHHHDSSSRTSVAAAHRSSSHDDLELRHQPLRSHDETSATSSDRKQESNSSGRYLSKDRSIRATSLSASSNVNGASSEMDFSFSELPIVFSATAPDLSKQRQQSQLSARDTATSALSMTSSYHLPRSPVKSTSSAGAPGVKAAATSMRSLKLSALDLGTGSSLSRNKAISSSPFTYAASDDRTSSMSSSDMRVQRLLREREQLSASTSSNNSEADKNAAATAISSSPFELQQHLPTSSAAVEEYLKRKGSNAEAATTKSTTTNPLTTSPRRLLQAAREARAANNKAPTAAKSELTAVQQSHTLASVPFPAPRPYSLPEDEMKRTLNSAVAGWSTASLRSRHKSDQQPQLSSTATTAATSVSAADNFMFSPKGNSKVDRYLASRMMTTATTTQQSKSAAYAVLRVSSLDSMDFLDPKDDDDSATDRESDSPSDMESSDDDDDNNMSDGENNVSSDEKNVAQEWSVRVCVVSAVDFPASVVPNLPFSPLLKVGLVPLPIANENPQGEEGEDRANDSKRQLAAHIEKVGLSAISKARIRCTSSKVLSKRDNGSVEFHEEMRWDNVRNPQQVALALELSSRAVMAPANSRESPPSQNADPLQISAAPGRAAIGDGDNGRSGIGGLFRGRNKTSESAEMETANAAAAVAKLLVDDSGGVAASTENEKSPEKSMSVGKQSEFDVKLRPRKKRKKKVRMTEDLRLGSQVVPLSCLSLELAMNSRKSARIEQWFELEGNGESMKPMGKPKALASATSKRNPSILLEISFAAPDILDDSEDDLDEDDDADAELKASFSKRASIKIRNQLKQEVTVEEKKIEEPTLQPGLIDFACVVGARDIGDQKSDDGTQGWVNTCPECALLEQFPPNDEFHFNNGRQVTLPNMVQWFCFPEGVKLWRGATPPNAEEMNLKRFSASTPPNIVTSTAYFDACLGCTTSFSWFVIASNSEEFGSETSKTYGAVIRFYVPAPLGIDPTQDDFAQTLMPGSGSVTVDISERKRLWVPLGICLTSNLPIVGIMEAMLLRMCEEMAAKGSSSISGAASVIREDLADLIIRFQKPISGVVNCSIPFLSGERFHVTLPPRNGLPPLPHGNAIASVCRLLGADGLNFLLAALLTECKILLHSDDIANLCLVAEVATSLLYPFQWLLPYVPVLPSSMMEFIEAPLSYLLGVPTCCMNNVDPSVLEDVVVVDLDRDYSSNDVFEGRRSGTKTKSPTPLPASVASNVSKAVYRLLRAEEEVEDFGNSHMAGARSFPRMEAESLAEREFRLSVAVEVSGLIRGLNDSLVYASSSSQPVFNADKFLQTAPVMFEDQRGTAIQGGVESTIHRVVSPRSRRFMSLFVNCQHFHQLLEMLEHESLFVFREIMGVRKSSGSRGEPSLAGKLAALETEKPITNLSKKLQKIEDKIPTYRVTRQANESAENDTDAKTLPFISGASRFPVDLLQPIVVSGESSDEPSGSGEGVKQISLQYLVELEKNPWKYHGIFGSDCAGSSSASIIPEKVKLRDAIGERRYRAWQIAQAQDRYDGDEVSVISDDSRGTSVALDLSSLVTSASMDIQRASTKNEEGQQLTEEEVQQQRLSDAKDRDVLRRCLERARVSGESVHEPLSGRGRDLVSEAEATLQNPSARRFLLAILGKRSPLEGTSRKESRKKLRPGLSTSASKLEPDSFEVLVRLGCAMLDACMDARDFDSSYALLKFTAGLYTTIGDSDGGEASLVYLTGRIGLHPVFADLGLWEIVKKSHILARQEVRQEDTAYQDVADKEADEYEAAVTTLYEMVGYGIPAEDLARFASRVSEQNRWFKSERGQALLMLSRRLCIRREHGEVSTHSGKQKSDLELMSSASPSKQLSCANGLRAFDDLGDYYWVETGWCHPAAKSSRRASMADNANTTRRPGTQNLLNMLEEQKLPKTGRGSNRMKRASVTTMAYLGSSVVATGALDGGVFLARKVRSNDANDDEEGCGVRGLHLDWGSSGSRYAVGASATAMDGEYGVGAVTCLAATRGSNQSYQTLGTKSSVTKDVAGPVDDEDLLHAIDGCRVVAGTTCGDLRVWSVKDVLAATFYADGGKAAGSSSFNSPRRKGGTDFAAGSSLTRLKFSLRGRALSGHRGGVSCVDVPSNVYRPDSIVSGGADGLIKLWSLRTPTGSGRSDSTPSSRLLSSPGSESPHNRAARNGDALSILSGHGGRILCVKTAWHGDRLLSGGADRIVRVWDIAGSGGRCLNSLSGHFGWVTAVRYWGPNTIISASTDRSIALWDARVRSSPLFTLRHHYAPVSDLLVGSRTDPVMVSSAMDGTVAAWDFRHLSGSADRSQPSTPNSGKKNAKHCKVVRDPVAQLYMRDFVSKRRQVYGPVMLSKATRRDQFKTIYCLGSDATLREWDIQTGQVVSDHITGHCDTISGFCSLQGDQLLDTQLEGTGNERATGTITASWDGTVRFRSLRRRPSI